MSNHLCFCKGLQTLTTAPNLYRSRRTSMVAQKRGRYGRQGQSEGSTMVVRQDLPYKDMHLFLGLHRRLLCSIFCKIRHNTIDLVRRKINKEYLFNKAPDLDSLLSRTIWSNISPGATTCMCLRFYSSQCTSPYLILLEPSQNLSRYILLSPIYE